MTEPTAITVAIFVAIFALGVAVGYAWGFIRGTNSNMARINNILNKYKNRI